MPAIKVHHTQVDTASAWDGNAEVGKLNTPITASVANSMFAYYDTGGEDANGDGYPDIKGAYKFPHHNVTNGKPGAANLAGVNNAQARLSQAKIPQDAIAGVRAHLQAHQDDAKKGREMDNPVVRMFHAIADMLAEKSRAVNVGDIWNFVQTQLDNATTTDPNGNAIGGGWVLDVYVDAVGTFALVTKDDGKLYKYPVIIDAQNQITLGTPSEVTMEFAPVANSRQLQIQRQADGKMRWFAFPACTAVLNRVGEIDSTALFDSFVEYAERTGNYPELDFWHLGEQLRLGKADWVGREGVAYCASGLFDDTPIAQAAAKSLETERDYWGLSIAYLPIQEPDTIRSQEGIKIPVFNVGINRFISLLPENAAASILTSIKTKEEVNRMNEKMKAALKKLTGDNQALFDELELKLDSVIRSSEGMISREAPILAQAPAAPVVEQRASALTPDDIAAVVNSPEFAAKVTELFKEYTSGNAQQPMQHNERASEDKTAEVLQALVVKVDDLIKDRDAQKKTVETQIQEILDDLPSKMTRQNTIIRPRTAQPIVSANPNKQRPVDLAKVAADTLEKMTQEEN